jgi:Mrp family chromosome partitioning ATPase
LLNQKNREIIEQKNININDLNPNVLIYQDRNRLNLIETLIETQNQIDILSTRYKSLINLEKEINQKLAIIPDVIKQYNELDRQLILNNNILNTLSTQKETLRVEAAQKENPWQLISELKLPRDQDNHIIGYPPDPKKKLVAGLGAGFLLGFLVAVLWEKKADIFYEESDLEYCFGQPILGKIKLNNLFNSHQNKLSSETINDDIIHGENGSFISNIIENSHNNGYEKSNNIATNKLKIRDLEEKSFKELSVNLHFKLSKITPNSILISSLSPEDNQDFVTANLAKRISQIDKKVLLIDLNSKNSQINSFFELDNEENLVSLEEEDTIQIIQRIDNYDNLVILNTKESDLKKNIYSTLNKNFDLIIYNSSFFLDNYELSLLAEKTEGILMVVKIKSTSFSSLQKAIKRINDYNLNLLGFIVVD